MVSSKEAGTVLAGSVVGYALQQVVMMIDPQINTPHLLLKPSSIATIIGGFVVPLYIWKGKRLSEKSKLVLVGLSAYYVPGLIQLARNLAMNLSAAPSRFARVAPRVPIAYANPYPVMSHRAQTIF